MKAIALLSGGLDSILAARLVKEQGVGIIPVYFKIPFCHRQKNKSGQRPDVAWLAQEGLGETLLTIDIQDEFLRLIENPAHGFGSGMNPCIDCKILMLKKAKELMEKEQASFVVTGEVLGQRPMSQHRNALDTIAQEAGLNGYVVRPLSALLLDETVAERQGWIDRKKMLDCAGRGRSRQIALAAAFNIQDYQQPAGGCLLTEPEFSRRLKDLIKYHGLSLRNVELLKIGRHFRISPEAKLVVGRDERENEELGRLAQAEEYIFEPHQDTAGPTAISDSRLNESGLRLACSIVCRYCDLNARTQCVISYRRGNDRQTRSMEVLPASEATITNLRI